MVSNMNATQKKEKIIKMKLQTAKVLWGENRKEATFLVLESIDDTRADDLRDQMGFDEDFEVDHSSRSSVPVAVMGIGAVVLIVLSFLLGTVLDLNGAVGYVQTYQALTENQLVETIISPTPEPSESFTQSPVQSTETRGQIQLTQVAIEDKQTSSMSLLDATETARYSQATATENARVTQAAGG